ncbi:hypothetical protein [Cytobacillus gottheilii]|uniref:hypothetical protein n=1 Tax=Cytobacillus gottheilii TaxID=859144 RepID=UPI002494D4CF|nr:hypothetical protein [Cytobacillus gottheilii]
MSGEVNKKGKKTPQGTWWLSIKLSFITVLFLIPSLLAFGYVIFQATQVGAVMLLIGVPMTGILVLISLNLILKTISESVLHKSASKA